jgi:4-amino-4-deoxy-L-arabinose transferase-like glycosyltransferase
LQCDAAQVPEDRAGRWQILLYAATLLIAAIFLFARLGHYALWDDEAQTALIGEGVWQTGDTSALVGHNIVAYGAGVELRNLKMRYLPPLQYYLVAPFVGLWPGQLLAARLPFAICGFGAVLILLEWVRRDAAALTFAIFVVALVGNVSLWLFCRQCRYYSVAILCSVALAYLYTRPSLGR